MRSHGLWLSLDDDRVDPLDIDALESFYGLTDRQLNAASKVSLASFLPILYLSVPYLPRGTYDAPLVHTTYRTSR